jgi:hypothetical protein
VAASTLYVSMLTFEATVAFDAAVVLQTMLSRLLYVTTHFRPSIKTSTLDSFIGKPPPTMVT